MKQPQFPAHKKSILNSLTPRAKSIVALGIPSCIALSALLTAEASTCPMAPSGHSSGPGFLEPGFLLPGHNSVVLNGHFSASGSRYTHCSHSNFG